MLGKKTHVVAVVGDIHGNSTVALCPPSFSLEDGGTRYSSKYQLWLWRKWEELWEEVGKVKRSNRAKLTVVVNGEIVDDNKHSSTELMSKNPNDILSLGTRILEPAYSLLGPKDNLIVIRGTEAHTGPASMLDESVASDLSATPSIVDNGEVIRYSWYHFRARFNGTLIDIAHHPGTGHRLPWTKGGDANRLAARVMMQCAEYDVEIPDLVIRGHNHRESDSYDNHRTRAIIMPSWQLGSSYGHRLGGDWLKTGGLYVVCKPGGEYEVVKRFHNWPVEQIWEPS